MENNQRSNNNQQNDRMGQQDPLRNEQNNESLNTASGLRNQSQREQDSAGSGRSYDYGSENNSEEDANQQLGRNSNQQNVSNPVNTPGTGNDNLPGRSDSRAGTGSGQTTKQSVTGSDFDGQNRTS